MVDEASGEVWIVVSDLPRLAESGRSLLDGVPVKADAVSMIAADGKIVFPVTMDASENADSRLAVVDAETLDLTMIDLGEPLPYQLRYAGGLVYVTHSFTNPAFGPLSEFKHVSVVDLATGEVEGHDLSSAANRIAVSSKALFALGEDGEDGFRLHSYELPGFTPIENFEIAPPGSMPDAYALNVILPQEGN